MDNTPGDAPTWEDRDYYRIHFGFDPVTDVVDVDQKWHRLEDTFPLLQDPVLHARGVTISARVEWREPLTKFAKIQNRIVFRRPSGKEETVDCVHTIVTRLPVEEFAKTDWNDPTQVANAFESTEFSPIELSPAGHFAALKSFVAGVAELGLGLAFDGGFFPGEAPSGALPLGFNAELLHGVLEALMRLDPDVGKGFFREYLLALADQVPGEWFTSRLPVLDEIFVEHVFDDRSTDPEAPDYLEWLSDDLYELVFGDPAVLEALMEAVDGPTFLEYAVLSPFTPPDIAETLTSSLKIQDPTALARVTRRSMRFEEWKLTPAIEHAWERVSLDEISVFLEDCKVTSKGSVENPYPALGRLPDAIPVRAMESEGETMKRNLVQLPNVPPKCISRLGFEHALGRFAVEVDVRPSKRAWRLILAGEKRARKFDFPIVAKKSAVVTPSGREVSPQIPRDWESFLRLSRDFEKEAWLQCVKRATLYPFADFVEIPSEPEIEQETPAEPLFDDQRQAAIFPPDAFHQFLNKLGLMHHPWTLSHHPIAALPLREDAAMWGGTISGRLLEWLASCTRLVDHDHPAAITLAHSPGVPYVCFRNNLSGLFGMLVFYHPDAPSGGEE